MQRDIIVLAGSFIMPDGNALSVHYSAVAKLLERLGYRVVFISWKPELITDESGYKQTVYDGRTCYEIPYPCSSSEWVKNIFNSGVYKRILEKTGKESIYALIVDGIKFHNVKSLFRFSKHNGIHYVYHLSEWPKEPIDKTVNSYINVISSWIEMNKLCPRIKNVLSVSRFAAEQLNKNKNMNAVQMPVFNDKTDDKWIIKNDYQPCDIVKIGYAGNLDRIGYKERIDWLVKAACIINSSAKKVEVHLVGITKQQFKEACPDISNMPEFDNSVVFYGRKRQEECIQILGVMDYNFIVRNASWNMKCGFPTKLGESFACGVPVLISDYAYIDEFVKQGKTGWLLQDITYPSFEDYLKTAVSANKEKRLYMHEQCRKSNVLDYTSYVSFIGDYLKNL